MLKQSLMSNNWGPMIGLISGVILTFFPVVFLYPGLVVLELLFLSSLIGVSHYVEDD